MDDEAKIFAKAVMSGLIIIASSIGGCMYGMPRYNVYHQELEGEAELATLTLAPTA